MTLSATTRADGADAPPRRLAGRVVIATHNPGKLAEMNDLLAPYGIKTVSAGELGLAEPVEDGTMFAENAAIKAHAAAKASGLAALSDDSGLCVDALDGAPGLFTADWAGQPRDFPRAFDRVARELRRRGVEPDGARAHFVSALVIAWPDGEEALFEGRVHGAIAFPPRGDRGFGYDPFFRPDGYDRTFGEMSATEKHGLPPLGAALSHRARAFLALAAACLSPAGAAR
jgi:XTP/dITP diphosphohydrolase